MRSWKQSLQVMHLPCVVQRPSGPHSSDPRHELGIVPNVVVVGGIVVVVALTAIIDERRTDEHGMTSHRDESGRKRAIS